MLERHVQTSTEARAPSSRQSTHTAVTCPITTRSCIAISWLRNGVIVGGNARSDLANLPLADRCCTSGLVVKRAARPPAFPWGGVARG